MKTVGKKLLIIQRLFSFISEGTINSRYPSGPFWFPSADPSELLKNPYMNGAINITFCGG